MRSFKFRGKRLKDGKWIYGNLADYSMSVLKATIEKKVIFGDILNFATDNFGFVVEDCAVNPYTVGQFSGVLDRNGKEIYEGDIVNLYHNYRGKKKRTEPKVVQGVIIWSLCGLRIRIKDYPEEPWNHRLIQYPKQIEVIGNIHDNPELISDKQ